MQAHSKRTHKSLVFYLVSDALKRMYPSTGNIKKRGTEWKETVKMGVEKIENATRIQKMKDYSRNHMN